MKIGVIADDFTGATDAASFIVSHGLTAIQVSGLEAQLDLPNVDALVVSLKTRSCEKSVAVSLSLQACDWLISQGCQQIYFKYCSTFDSTSEGNIGPVIEALMEKLRVNTTLICPALPVNGRTVYQGHLFVYTELLSESGMKNHPITPMTDSNIVRLVENQTHGKAGLLSWHDLQRGAPHAELSLDSISLGGNKFIVCDTLTDGDLKVIAHLCREHRLVTGGSGLVGALAGLQNKTSLPSTAGWSSPNKDSKGIVISGSCSLMTNKQVNSYQEIAASYKVDINRCVNEDDYIDVIEDWVLSQPKSSYFPMVFATVGSDELRKIQHRFGLDVSEKVETLFHELVKRLHQRGYERFISAGGETSGTVTQALKITQFKVGTEIAPGVPWMSSLDGNVYLALKSGNFGNEHFFKLAQDILK